MENVSQKITNLGVACLLILAGLKPCLTGRVSVKLFYDEGAHVRLGGLFLIVVGLVLFARNLLGEKWKVMPKGKQGEPASKALKQDKSENARPEQPK